MADDDIDRSLAVFTNVVDVVGTVLTDISRYDSYAADSYYSSIDRANELIAQDRESKRRHKEEMAKIGAMERLKSQENELKKLQIFEETKRFMSLLEASERAYEKKLNYLQMLANNAQEYFIPLRDKLVTLIEQTEESCRTKSGKEYRASIIRLESLKASLDKCSDDYNELMFNLKEAVSNARIEMLPNQQIRMLEN